MATRIDLALNNNDTIIQDNDVLLAESDDQHIVDTINACPGWWKENFTDGVALLSYVKAKGIQQVLARSIKLNLQSDGYLSSPAISYNANGQLSISTNVQL
jgi:hypothetical protein